MPERRLPSLDRPRAVEVVGAWLDTRRSWLGVTRRLMTVCLGLRASVVPAFSETLLPSQDTRDFFTAKICQDRYVLSIIGSSIDSVLNAKSVLAKGMQADDIRLEAVNAKDNAVLCSMTVAAKGVVETVTYVIAPEDKSFMIVLSGSKGSKLFPHDITMRPAK